MTKEKKVEEKETEVSLPPLGFEVIKREFIKDKLALIALIIVVTIIAIAFIAPLVTDLETIARKVDIFNRYTKPGELGYILGSDDGGRDVLAQLIVGTRNSLIIGWSVSILSSIIGITIGVISGYYGGRVDNIIMRIVDFIMILPTLVIIIAFTVIMRKFNMFSLILILSMFAWTGKARLFRTNTLSQASRDYVSASKTMGTPDWKIMLFGVLPNLFSLMITNLTLSLAGNIGLETGLTFLGFGLPLGTPSLGTLIAAANNPDVIDSKKWVWLPATLLILLMMLSINYIGQALQRAADSKQRLG